MNVGLLSIHIHLSGIGSLKAKRSIVKSLIERTKNRYNFSVAEIGANDSKDLAIIGLAVVSKDARFIDKQMDTVINFIKSDHRFYVGTIEREIFPSGF